MNSKQNFFSHPSKFDKEDVIDHVKIVFKNVYMMTQEFSRMYWKTFVMTDSWYVGFILEIENIKNNRKYNIDN